MAAYKDLVGQKITVVTSNPPEPKTGQMWYNSTDGKLKGLGITSAWRSSSPLLVARDAAGSAGTQTTATIFGGNINPGNTNSTDEYNGTSWSEQNDIPGNYRNGSTFGTQTAALYVGGYSAPVPNSTTIQIYDGTNWTTSPATLGTGGNSISSTGTSTAGLVFGGSNRLNVTEEWNGSAMSTGGNLTTSKYGRGSANQAPSENAMSAGGGIPAQTTVENYDGTSWSTLPSLAVATNSIKGAGTASSAMMMGGGPGDGPVFNTSTEFNISTNTITAAAWASGTALPSARFNGASAGTTTAGIIAGGELAPGTRTGETVYFDGSSWTAQPATLSPAPNADGVKMAGTQTAAILNSFRGGGSPGPAYTDARSWNGSAWSTIPSTSSSHSFSNLFRNGTPSAATTIGGDNEVGGIQSAVEEYNGSSWGSETALPAGRGNMAAFGTPSAGVIAGGNLGPGTPNRTATALEYDGSSWTTTGSITAAATTVGGGGTQTTGIIFGGYNPTPAATANTNTYDGTVFSTAPSMATARGGLYSIGSSSGAYAAGGNPPVVTTVEEFTPETTAVNIADFATS